MPRTSIYNYMSFLDEDTVEHISEHVSAIIPPVPAANTEESTTLPNEVSTGVPAEPVELPEEVTPEKVTEVITQVEEIRDDVEENGLTPQTMRAYLALGLKDYEPMYQVKFPGLEELKPNNPNVLPAAKMIIALNTIISHLRTHFPHR